MHRILVTGERVDAETAATASFGIDYFPYLLALLLIWLWMLASGSYD